MDKFIVSARKYRPQTFDTVVGQAHITTTLKNAIKHQQLAHAFLFCGPRGVGKTTCARILAKTINCENVTKDGEACNECHSCTSFNEGTSLNIHELDAASNNSVDDIRTLVEQVRFAPQAGTYKVYIIDEVHMLSSSAFNAFLKTLEEPPPYAIFILATTEKHKILPTILSRCQIFDFKRITTQDTVAHLQDICRKEETQADAAALQLIAQKSEGCMRDALSIMDKIVSFTNGEVTYANTLEHLNILDADYYFRLMDCMQQQDLAGAMLLYDDIDRKGFEGDLVLNGFAEFIRNLLVCKDEKAARLMEVVESFRDRYVRTAQQVSAAYLISALNILNEAEINFKAARNKRLHVELALIKLTYLQQAISITASDEGVGKKKLIETAKPVAFRNVPDLRKQEAPKEKKETTTTPATSYKAGATQEAKLIIEEPKVNYQPKNTASETPKAAERPVQQTPPPNTQPAGGGLKLGMLQNIRQQFANMPANSNTSSIPLSTDKLMEYWNQFAKELKDNRNPAFQSFYMATLNIINDGCFEVVTNNNLEQKFIEQERRVLSEYLQEKFNNRQLLFSITVSDNPSVDTTPVEKPLTARDQYFKIVEQYPLVNELRDKLKLALE
ncbi:MAG: DNA polymerase III subunit gamma/tau [Chitinophagaceae bacterium]